MLACIGIRGKLTLQRCGAQSWQTHCRVGIQLPSVEVRFQDLTVEAQAEAAGRELPSIFNSYRNWVEVIPALV